MPSKAPFSPYARTLLRSARTGWGVFLSIAALLFLYAIAATGEGIWLVPVILFAAVGAPLLVSGINAWRRAATFNETDFAYSRFIHNELSALAGLPPGSAFDTDNSCVSIRDASVVELERHFDQDTAGAIVGSLDHSMNIFGHSSGIGIGQISGSGALFSIDAATMRGFITGVSNAQLAMNSTTRSNLLGDALFSVLEFLDRDGQRDTMRIISMSGPAATQWMGDLIFGVSQSLGGGSTHAGLAVAQWIQPIVANFTPRDISYTTDRLKAMERDKDLTLLVASGQIVGRNAMLATSIEFSNGTVTRIFPHRFPAMFGICMGRATRVTLGLPEPSHPDAITTAEFGQA